MLKRLVILIPLFIFYGCKDNSGANGPPTSDHAASPPENPALVVLGTVQDAGSPHIGCQKDCCRDLFSNPDNSKKVVSLGLIDPENKKCYMIEATPDFPEQMRILNDHAPFNQKQTPDGIFLTHAHIGHYTGLMYLGKEGMDTKAVPVYAMPKMKVFLEENGPWSQLVSRNNIVLREMAHQNSIQLTENFSITPFTVPHRDEYSETVGYIISGPAKKALFIPDIDKWEKWETAIVDVVAAVDYAYIDATFYDSRDIKHRDISEIPHPFIIESMALFKTLPAEEKSKIRFIHINHSNPVLRPDSEQSQTVLKNGYGIARIFDVVEL